MSASFTHSLFRDALQSVGYDLECVKSRYRFADPASKETPVRQIWLAAFSDYPQNYQNACVGVVDNARNEESKTLIDRHRALGAPLLMEIRGERVQPWTMRADGGRLLGNSFALKDTKCCFQRNCKDWGLEALRNLRRTSPAASVYQPDFFDRGLAPALEREFQTQLTEMLEQSFLAVKNCYQQVHHRKPDTPALFSFLFRFVTAKIFMDRADAKNWKDLSGPLEILKAAEKHTGLLDQPDSDYRRKLILETAWHHVSQSLHFQNLAVRDLAFVAESAFITPKTRKELGVHSTPEGLAEYIVERLPWEEVSCENRIVFEPFCGHGIFLAKAMERMRADLPAHYTPQTRHQYFRERLFGVEKEALSLEICRQVLTLSDYPNGNSWDGLCPGDVFQWSQWTGILQKASVVLANPPYEKFAADYRKRIHARKTKPPAEMLWRLMQHPPALLGLVLPQSFLTDPVCREANRQIARFYERVDIVELPPIFRYADNETVALMASGRRENGKTVRISYAEVPKGREDRFLEDFQVSQQRSEEIPVPALSGGPVFSLRLNSSTSVFSELTTTFTLDDVAEIHKGINWKARTDQKPKSAPRTDVACDKEKKGYHRGAEKMNGNLSQFQLLTKRWLSLKDEHQDPSTQAHKRPWQNRKVVCNAARFQRGSHWRLAAWADEEGLAFTKQFFAIWPEKDISEYAIAAILNSPLANAFSFEQDIEQHNHVNTLSRLPMPAREHLRHDGELHCLARKLQIMLGEETGLFELGKRKSVTEDKVRAVLLNMDAAVLQAYGLNAAQQRRLLAPFQGQKRPLPAPYDQAFQRDGYFPEHFKDDITLRDFVGISYHWDDKLNERRCDLIEKKIKNKGLPDAEKQELEHLQHLADLLVRLKEPYPLAELDGYIAKLKADRKWIGVECK